MGNKIENFEVLDVDQAIEKLSKYKGKKIIICTVDFESQEEKKRRVSTTEEGCKLIRNSSSIFYNDDDFVPNMDLFSNLQEDIHNIIPKGTMHNILFCGKLE